jgi:hypothetical protein
MAAMDKWFDKEKNGKKKPNGCRAISYSYATATTTGCLPISTACGIFLSPASNAGAFGQKWPRSWPGIAIYEAADAQNPPRQQMLPLRAQDQDLRRGSPVEKRLFWSVEVQICTFLGFSSFFAKNIGQLDPASGR